MQNDEIAASPTIAIGAPRNDGEWVCGSVRGCE